MKKPKIKKVSDIIIIGTMLLVIISNIIFSIYLYMDGGHTIDLTIIVVTVLFLIVYLYTEKLFKKKLDYIPDSYYFITAIFALFSAYLGSYLNFYEKFSWWDNVLHFTSGVLIGLVSIIIVSYFIVHNFGEFKRKKDIFILVTIGFLLSISFGVFWEFYEFLFDVAFDGNMQRSIIIDNPETFDPSPYMRPSGRFVDPGLKDTMNDLFLATAGALIASIYAFTHFAAIQFEKKVEE